MSETISNKTHVEFYDQTSQNIGKQFNLWIRGVCYDLYYLPRLLEWNVFPEKGQAAEIGCGIGHKLKKTRQKVNPNVFLSGIDASIPMLKQAIKKHPKLRGIVQIDNAFFLESLKDQSQDVLMYFQILHHFDGQEIEQAIDVAYKKLKTGGKIVVIDTFDMQDKPLRKQWFNVIEPIYAMLAARSKDGLQRYHNQPRESFINFMKSHGFQLTHETGDEMPYIISEMMVFEKE